MHAWPAALMNIVFMDTIYIIVCMFAASLVEILIREV